MFLEYGINESERYIHISQVDSGRVSLSCPYCGQSLIARKGQHKQHHFAHDGATCRLSDKDFDALDVPVFDRFHTYMDGNAWKHLRAFRDGQSANMRVLADRELVYVNRSNQSGEYELTGLGKIPFGLATLTQFADFQLSKIYERHHDLSETIRLAQFGLPYTYDTNQYQVDPNPASVMPALADLYIYRSQVARVFNLDLYLLEIKSSNDLLYKIGVTSDIDRRIIEIKRDLKPFMSVININPICLLNRRGAVEHYAQYRYREYQKSIDNLTEYFEFDDKLLAIVLSDFVQLDNFQLANKDSTRYHSVYDESQPNMPTRRGLITTIIENERPEIETALYDTIERTQPAKEADIHHKSRLSEDDNAILDKYPLVVEHINNGFSLRVTARKCRVSLKIVRKVQTILMTVILFG